jgi:protease-4
MFRTAACLAIVAGSLSFGGCRQAMQLCTHSHLVVDQPVESHVTMDLSPQGTRGPVREMHVGRCGQGLNADKIAIVDIDGPLFNTNMTAIDTFGENPVALFRERLDAVAGTPGIRAIVVRVNSSGGSVTASDIMRYELERFRNRTGLPVVAALMDVATGGAYHVATAADVIVAHPTALTGGVGVIINLYNLGETMRWANVLDQSLKAGEHIDMGTVAQALPPATQDMLQQIADEYHRRFRQAVQQSRRDLRGPPEELFDGRVFTGPQALERGLVDRLGYLPDAIAIAGELAGIGAEPQVVLFHRDEDLAFTAYAVTPRTPSETTMLRASIPGLDRSRLPLFLYMWQPDPTLAGLQTR